MLDQVWPIMTRSLNRTERRQAFWSALALFGALLIMVSLLPVV